jgi:hypothetical protein
VSHALLMTMQSVACVAVLHSILCRAALMDHNTHRELRWSFVFMAAATMTVLISPLMPIIWPDYFLGSGGIIRWRPWRTPWSAYVLFIVSVALVQASASRYWGDGPPHQFQRRPA